MVLLTTGTTRSQEANGCPLQWNVIAELPPGKNGDKALGLAGPVVGIHNGVLLVAGGANFPEGMPWTGGQKKYYDDVYILQNDGKEPYAWLKAKSLRLKQKLAYSGNVSLEEGIVCVGGETDKGPTNEVFLLQWDRIHKTTKTVALPSLPLPLTNAAVTNIGKTIYVAGGETGQTVSDRVFRMDISSSKPQWQELPRMPIAVSHAVAVAQSNGEGSCVYVVGGRKKAETGLSDLYSTVFCFHPEKNSWEKRASINDGKQTTNLSAASAIALGDSLILLIGGDKGTIFHQIETFNYRIATSNSAEEKEQLGAGKAKLLENHPGFSRDVLAYHTKKDSWMKIGELPGLGPVTTTAVRWNDDIVIPSGEIKPGRRSPEIIMGTVCKEKFPDVKK